MIDELYKKRQPQAAVFYSYRIVYDLFLCSRRGVTSISLVYSI